MPLKLNVGVSKKIGLPDYGSLGATCHVECELDSTLLQHDLETFHRHVRNAYVACAQAVNDELVRNQQGNGQSQATSAPQDDAVGNGPARNGNGHHNGNPSGSGNGRHRASEKQVDYINQLARQIRGLGLRRLETLAQKMFGKPMAVLTSLDASGLIDTLKAIRAGEINLENALSGATT